MKKYLYLTFVLGGLMAASFSSRAQEAVSFETLRTLISGESGSTVLDSYAISGVIISDKTNMNMEVNPNTGTKGQGIDFTVNDKTAYIQDAAGAYGFRLQLEATADNIFSRYDNVTIDVTGFTLTKEANPERYTISGVTSDKVKAQTAGTSADVPAKLKTMESLTDADVYTYVTLKNVQMAFPYGRYVNVHEAYAYGGGVTDNPVTAADPVNRAGTANPFFDCAPNVIQSQGGSAMYYLINMKTPWRNPGSVGIPKGIGRFSGIIVHSWLSRYGTEQSFGKYQIRPVEQADIALSADESTRFTEDLAVWTFNRFTLPLSTATWSSASNISGGTHGYQWGNGNAALTKTVVELNQDITWDFRYAETGVASSGIGFLPPENGMYNANNANAQFTITSATLTGGTTQLRYNTVADCDNLNIVDKYTDRQGTNNVYNVAAAARNSNIEGLLCDGAFGLYGSFWHATEGGQGGLLKFSTEGIAGDKLNLSFTIGTGRIGKNDNPTKAHKYWHVECSTDNGATYAKVTGSDFIVRNPSAWDSNLPLYTTVGNIPYTLYLPDTLLNKSAVWLKLIPSSNIVTNVVAYASAVEEEAGPATGVAGWLRFGEIAIRANKADFEEPEYPSQLTGKQVAPSLTVRYDASGQAFVASAGQIAAVLTIDGKFAAAPYAQGIYLVEVKSNNGATSWHKVLVK
ncbi:MAG: hypothetical protein LBC40_01150 [Dysgonamonadaceae bacterium]|jgi:hypothetical protein|nr:hypothetical protein [Dysgonamonadaceae bacterium]